MRCTNTDCLVVSERLIQSFCPRCYQAWHKHGFRACSFCSRQDVILNCTPNTYRRLHVITCRSCLPIRLAAWSYAHDCCQSCGAKNLPHKADGLCKTCYRRKQLLGEPLRCTQEGCSKTTYRNFAAGKKVMCADCYNEQGRRIYWLVEARWPLTKIAKEFHLCTRTIKKIYDFYRCGGQSGLPLHHYRALQTTDSQ